MWPETGVIVVRVGEKMARDLLGVAGVQIAVIGTDSL
jgi:hypothetical protein